MCEAQIASNDLNILVKFIRYMSNQNDGHSSCNHGLKCNTSSIDPHVTHPILSVGVPTTPQKSPVVTSND